jgi:glycosyl hydrolase family 18 (putative chitinase)
MHAPVIKTVIALVVIGSVASVLFVWLKASPRSTGAPAYVMPAPAGTALPPLDSAAWPTTAPSADPGTCKKITLQGANGAWIASYLDDNTKLTSLVASQARQLDLVDFNWVSVSSPTTFAQSDSFAPTPAAEMAKAAGTAGNPCGLRFLTLTDSDPSLSHAADVRMMAEILTQSSVRSAHVLAIAQLMADLPLAVGLTIDYQSGLPQNVNDLRIDEQVAGWHGLTIDQAVSRLSGDYTELIREIALAMHQQGRLVRLAAMVRFSDDVDASTSDIAPFLLNYGTLAKYVDQMVLTAYDFHYSTSDPGVIAPFSDVADVLNYVRSYNVPWSKLALGVPMYGYNWEVNSKGAIAVNASGQPVPATVLTATEVANDSKHWTKVTTDDGETEYSYTSSGQRHIVWTASTALAAEVAWLRRNYPRIGVDVWITGNADPVGSAATVKALGS